MWSDFITLVLIVISAAILVRGCDAHQGYDAGYAEMYITDEYWI